ncbi:hypothetical protein VP01_4945g1 [Puccinia sorghi]|uniref:Reverse transcriptase Ty1/copia-type domain-containing protein n=1 Tax=Puccinia sorghi TaxID=27349 RepID=A0A0L6UMR2_9BASI|nr:hypothetical protein VP01_4945g1 [Puccinia sorghi]
MKSGKTNLTHLILFFVLMFAMDKKLPIRQFDVKSTFLYAPVKEELYIKTPEGSYRKAQFLCLKKSLYGLKQEPANWYETLTTWFEEINFHQSTSDPLFEGLFLHQFPNSTAHDPDTLLGMDVTITNDSISMCKEKLIDKGLKLLGLTEFKDNEFSKLGINYCTYTGLLNYLSCRTQPDLAPAVLILSSFNNDPGINHWKELLHFWKYVKGTRKLHLKLRPVTDDSRSIQHYTNATWADIVETCLSRSGSICFWKHCPIAWNSKKSVDKVSSRRIVGRIT